MSIKAQPATEGRVGDARCAPGVLLLLAPLFLIACHRQPAAPSATDFPAAQRPVAPLSQSSVSEEQSRDLAGEAEAVMAFSDVGPGMTVADIGAGEGYYTIRLARKVGAKGRVLAEDIVAAARDALAQRVEREQLDNVSVKLGEEDNPELPVNSFNRVFMVNMYHEIRQPYAFLWHLRPSLVQGGQVVVVDAERPVSEHGIPPRLLICEFAAVGYRRTLFRELPESDAYMVMFQPVGERPAPQQISPCRERTPGGTL